MKVKDRVVCYDKEHKKTHHGMIVAIDVEKTHVFVSHDDNDTMGIYPIEAVILEEEFLEK